CQLCQCHLEFELTTLTYICVYRAHNLSYNHKQLTIVEVSADFICSFYIMSCSKNDSETTTGSATKNYKLPFSMESIARDIAAMNGVKYVPKNWASGEKRKPNDDCPSSSRPKRKLVRLNLDELRRELAGSVKKPSSSTSAGNFQRRSTISRRPKLTSSPNKRRASAVSKRSSTNDLNRPSIVTRSSMTNLRQEPAVARRGSIATRSAFTNMQQKQTKQTNDPESVVAKRRKLEYGKHPAGRGLFLNVPPVTRSAKGPSSPVPNSPLLNMEEVEDDWINNREVIKKNCNKENAVNSASKANTLATIAEECDMENRNKVPDETTPSTDREFELLEEMCTNSQTPVTAISNLLKGTNIGSSKKKASKTAAGSSLEAKLKEECEKHEKILKKENERHLSEILRILNSKDINSNSLKANVPLVLLSSPTSCNYKDLRKSTLKKNLETKQLCLSPQSKGMEYYNSVKQVCNILETPKSERAATPSTRSISMKVRNQCFMLAETPKITKDF
ncbi:unnamed protein product, partial [Phyllotreta striolata]